MPEANKLYLDVSCLNRPFDDQSQARIRLEAAAVTYILSQVDLGRWEHVSSRMSEIEIHSIGDEERRRRVLELMPPKERVATLSEDIFRRAESLEKLGFKPADAVHIAAAESREADVMLTCDDRLQKTANRQMSKLKVIIRNPLGWLEEQRRATDT